MRRELSPKVILGVVAGLAVVGLLVFMLMRQPDLTTPDKVGLGTPAKAGEMPPGMKAPASSSPAVTTPGPNAEGSLGAVGKGGH